MTKYRLTRFTVHYLCHCCPLFFIVGPGFYPPMMHRLSLPGDQERWGDQDPSHTWAHSVEAITKIKGQGRTNSLFSQVIPIYGFGILLYIVYIIYKASTDGQASTAVYEREYGRYMKPNSYLVAQMNVSYFRLVTLPHKQKFPRRSDPDLVKNL